MCSCNLLVLSTGQGHSLQTHFLQGGGAPTGHMTHQGYSERFRHTSVNPQKLAPQAGSKRQRSQFSPSSPPARRVCLEKTRLSERHHSSLYKQLAIHASKWRELGVFLGFASGELNNVQANPNLQNTAPKSFLDTMLSEWLQWAPGDSQGSTSFATLEDLKAALREAGLGAAAHDLNIQTHS